jgi:hypothetical protein
MAASVAFNEMAGQLNNINHNVNNGNINGSSWRNVAAISAHQPIINGGIVIIMALVSKRRQ